MLLLWVKGHRVRLVPRCMTFTCLWRRSQGRWRHSLTCTVGLSIRNSASSLHPYSVVGNFQIIRLTVRICLLNTFLACNYTCYLDRKCGHYNDITLVVRYFLLHTFHLPLSFAFVSLANLVRLDYVLTFLLLVGFYCTNAVNSFGARVRCPENSFNSNDCQVLTIQAPIIETWHLLELRIKTFYLSFFMRI